MNKQVSSIMCIVLMGLWSASVYACGAGEEKMAVFMMSEKDESCIRAKAGKPFAIRFQSSPGTGYSWEFAVDPDKKLLEFLGEKMEDPGSGLLGGREFVVWTFRALAAGETEIAMKYARPWEKEVAPARTYVFKVKIR
jgi:inhibitor of cysteine peptidase